jgi:hypothetical protein
MWSDECLVERGKGGRPSGSGVTRATNGSLHMSQHIRRERACV